MKYILIILGCSSIIIYNCSKDSESFEKVINKEITRSENVYINFGDSCNIRDTEVTKRAEHGSGIFTYLICKECNYKYMPDYNYTGNDQIIITITKMNKDKYIYTINILIK
jgi:hypothetical protein